jgi:hypothetical protein
MGLHVPVLSGDGEKVPKLVVIYTVVTERSDKLLFSSLSWSEFQKADGTTTLF